MARAALQTDSTTKPFVKVERTYRTESVLGGETVLKTVVRSPLDLVAVLRKGLPYKALTELSRHLHVTEDDFARSISLPPRTLARRKKAGRLDLQESERVMRVAAAAATAAEIFGIGPSLRWLREANRALGGVSPLSLLDTDIGAEAVRDVLGRIEYGVFS